MIESGTFDPSREGIVKLQSILGIRAKPFEQEHLWDKKGRHSEDTGQFHRIGSTPYPTSEYDILLSYVQATVLL